MSHKEASMHTNGRNGKGKDALLEKGATTGAATGTGTQILELRVKNVKCIREVEISMDGEIHEIRGDTGQGKTSILQSIEGGLRGLDPEMIRNGEDKAEIQLTLSNATIKRIISRDGEQTLMVSDANGKAVDKAKEFLKTICMGATFRPIEFVQLGGGDAKGKTERLRRQRDMLLEAIHMTVTGDDVAEAVRALSEDHVEALMNVNLDGVQFDQHAWVVCKTIEERCYEFRAAQNAVLKEAESALKLTPAPERSAPKADLSACVAREKEAHEGYMRAQMSVQGRENLRAESSRMKQQLDEMAKTLKDPAAIKKTRAAYEAVLEESAKAGAAAKELIAELEAKLEDARKQLDGARTRYSEAKEKIGMCDDCEREHVQYEARCADLTKIEIEIRSGGESYDIDGLRKAYESAQADTQARRLQDAHDVAAKKTIDAKRKSELFDGLVKLFRDDLPKELLEASDLPVDGLGINEDTVTVSGVPLHQLGTSQQIRIGVLIAAALNPQAGFVLVDGAESMGKKDRAALAEVARERNLQLIMTYVDPEAVPAAGVTVMREGEAVGV